MADPNLTESAWQRAKVDAAGVYRTTTFQLGGALLTAIFSALALIAQEGQPTTTQVAVPILAAAVAILLSVVVVLACQLAAAPIRQRNELRQAWDRPTEVRPVNIELTLRNERRKASGFYRVRGDGMITRTKEDEEGAEEWTNRIVDLLTEHVGPDAAREFIEAPGKADQFKARLDAQTRALDQIIDRLGEG
jgi:hypothetical protein